MDKQNDNNEKDLARFFEKLTGLDHLPEEVLHDLAEGRIEDRQVVESIQRHLELCEECRHHAELSKAFLSGHLSDMALERACAELEKCCFLAVTNAESLPSLAQRIVRSLESLKDRLGDRLSIFLGPLKSSRKVFAYVGGATDEVDEERESPEEYQLDIGKEEALPVWFFREGIVVFDMFEGEYGYVLLWKDSIIPGLPYLGMRNRIQLALELPEDTKVEIRGGVVEEDKLIVLELSEHEAY